MNRFLVPVALAGAMIAAQAHAQTDPSDSVSDSPGYYVAPMIEPPPAFHGGQMTDPPPVEPFSQPNVGDPGLNQFPITTSHHRG